MQWCLVWVVYWIAFGVEWILWPEFVVGVRGSEHGSSFDILNLHGPSTFKSLPRHDGTLTDIKKIKTISTWPGNDGKTPICTIGTIQHDLKRTQTWTEQFEDMK
jgi:hypothetical protein